MGLRMATMFKSKYGTVVYPFCILLAVSLSRCRKYDVDQQAQVLYGEDLSSLMQRFRRTPEYLTILNDEVAEMHKLLTSVSDHTAYVFSLKLYDRVVQELGLNRTQGRSGPQHYHRLNVPIIRTTRKFYRPNYVKYKNEKTEIEEIFSRPNHILLRLRQGDKHSPSNLLDKYKKLHLPLTLEERNRMVELGFEYIGRAIHSMLQNMSPVDTPPQSTRQLYGDEYPVKSSTPHHLHEFQSTSVGTESETGSPRFRHSTHSVRLIRRDSS